LFGIGSWEFIIIAVLALLLFGPDKLPQFARTIGRFTRDFRRYKDLVESTMRAEVYAADTSAVEDPFKKGKEFRKKVESGEIGGSASGGAAEAEPGDEAGGEDESAPARTPAERAEALPDDHPLKAAMVAGEDVGIDDDLDLSSLDAGDLGWVPGKQSGGEVKGTDA
jgi:sec-independent protein translocase protein TatB